MLREGKVDSETAGIAASIVRKLARNELPNADEARALDDARKDAAASEAVAPNTMTYDERLAAGRRALARHPPMNPAAVGNGEQSPAAATRPQKRHPAPDAAAIEMLRQSPETGPQFDEVYGPGATQKALSIAPARSAR